MNDPPVNTVPDSLIGAGTGLFGFGASAIKGLAVLDANTLTTQLFAVDSAVQAADVGAVDGGASVSGSGTSTVTLTGSATEVDTTLGATNNVLYQSSFTFVGTDHLTMTTDDGGSSGTGGPMTTTDTAVINVVPPIFALIAGDGFLFAPPPAPPPTDPPHLPGFDSTPLAALADLVLHVLPELFTGLQGHPDPHHGFHLT